MVENVGMDQLVAWNFMQDTDREERTDTFCSASSVASTFFRVECSLLRISHGSHIMLESYDSIILAFPPLRFCCPDSISLAHGGNSRRSSG